MSDSRASTNNMARSWLSKAECLQDLERICHEANGLASYLWILADYLDEEVPEAKNRWTVQRQPVTSRIAGCLTPNPIHCLRSVWKHLM